MALFWFPNAQIPQIFFIFFLFLDIAWGLDFCDQNYWCREGHCCGNGRCCTYYYELWWFWLIWVLIALMSCCCFYQQRRLKKRRRRHSSSSRRSRRSSSQSIRTQSVFRPIFDPSKLLQLPTYEEVQDMPKDPPPYDILYETTLHESNIGNPSSSNTSIGATTDVQIVPADQEEIDNSLTAALLTNEEQISIDDIPAQEVRSPFPPSYSTVCEVPTDQQGCSTPRENASHDETNDAVNTVENTAVAKPSEAVS